jgi:hypothetical protein
LIWTYGQDPAPAAGHHGDGRSSHVRRVQRAEGP